MRFANHLQKNSMNFTNTHVHTLHESTRSLVHKPQKREAVRYMTTACDKKLSRATQDTTK